jgi:very-short-patch-repair endonuclease
MHKAGLPAPVREYPFAKDIKRKWRVDVAFPSLKLAIEIEGMAHRTRKQYLSDMEKFNHLSLRGWTLVRVYTRWIATERGDVPTGLALVKWALAAVQQAG